jgi:tetratricopeptide (TPR) repeat protein
MAVRLFPRSFLLRRWLSSGLLAVSLVGASVSLAPAQEPATSDTGETPNSSEVRRVDQVSSSEFSIPYADRLTAEATDAIAAQQYETAIAKLNESRELYNQLSLYYQELAEMFFGIDTRQNRSNRDKAIEAAQKRDEATYQLALIHRTQNEPEKAIPLLMEVLRSQQPTRQLGEQAYQQLFEMGFVDDPYEFRQTGGS